MAEAYGPRDAARRFAKVLAVLETRGAPTVVPLLLQALAIDAPLSLAELTTMATPAISLPTAFAELEVGGGCAADYDTWLTAVPA